MLSGQPGGESRCLGARCCFAAAASSVLPLGMPAASQSVDDNLDDGVETFAIPVTLDNFVRAVTDTTGESSNRPRG